jgi:hypothetical protein
VLALATSFLVTEELNPDGTKKDEDIFLIPDATMLVELVLLAIVLLVVWKYVVPPVSAAMA